MNLAVAPRIPAPTTGLAHLNVSTGVGPWTRNVDITPGPEDTFRVSDVGFGNPPTIGGVDAAKGADLLAAAEAFAAAKLSSPRPSGVDGGEQPVAFDLTWNGEQIGYAAPLTGMHPVAKQLFDATMTLVNAAGPVTA